MKVISYWTGSGSQVGSGEALCVVVLGRYKFSPIQEAFSGLWPWLGKCSISSISSQRYLNWFFDRGHEGGRPEHAEL